MKIRSFALLAALLATAAPAVAQQQGQPAPRGEHRGEHHGPGEHGRRMKGEGRRFGNPLEHLLQRREQLNLTAEQVARLEAVQRRVQEQNRPLMEQLRQLRGPAGARPERGARGAELTPEQREALRRTREQARPIMERLRENNQAARREVEQVLTDAQKQQLRQWHEQRGRRGEARRPRGERGERERRENREAPPQTPRS